MGTSASNKGSRGSSPIVPPWADTDGNGPGPAPDPNRFKGFRTQMGKFVSSGDGGKLRKALGRYARDTLGGRATGVRRFNQMLISGGALVGLLNELRSGGTGTGTTGVDLSRLVGMPVEAAIQAIVEAVAPDAGDRELIRVAMQEALIECLQGQPAFDPTAISDSLLVELLVEYLSQCVFTHIVYESGNSFGKGASTTATAQRENELMELIRVEVDNHAAPLLADGANLNPGQIQAVESQIIAGVLDIWEGFE